MEDPVDTDEPRAVEDGAADRVAPEAPLAGVIANAVAVVGVCCCCPVLLADVGGIAG